MKPFRSITTLAIATALSAVVMAQAPALNVKMGLWETTATMQMGGQVPGMDTSKMTPEQKAQIDATMKSMMGTPTVSKTCMTKEKFSQAQFGMHDEAGTTCKHTFTTNTPTALEMTDVCTGKTNTTMHMSMKATSPSTISSTMKSSTTENGKTMTVDMSMTGKWLGADCGDVK